MIRPQTLLLLICIASTFQDAYSWSISIKPESGHIRVNKSTTIMCRTSVSVEDCQFKIDGRATIDFWEGVRTTSIVVKNNGKPLYSAQYSGRGLEHGQCGLNLSNVAAGVYVVGCQLRDSQGGVRQEFMTLNVANNQPLRVKVNRKYQTAAPGSEVAVLCSTEKRQPLDHCAIRLASKQWVLFQQGHQSMETEHYHYHGRGLDKGHCGITLLNVAEGDSGMILCHVKAGLKSSVRASIVKVAEPKPETVISWDEKPHLSPGDILEAECVMKGAYPLPPMVWHYQSKILNRSEVEETTQASTFRWPWEDHIMRQKVVLRVGNRLGMKTLTCNADETGEILKSEDPVMLKYTNTSPNEILVSVFPKCGKRTSSKYYFTNKGKRIIKRDTKPISKGRNKLEKAALNGRTDNAPTNISSASNPASKTTTSRPTKATLPGEYADYVEPVWDEIDIENGSQSPLIPTEDETREQPPATGVAGGKSVFVASEGKPIENLPVSSDIENSSQNSGTLTDDLAPAPWLVGGKSVLMAPKNKHVEELPMPMISANATGRPAMMTTNYEEVMTFDEISAMVGAQPVLMAPERVGRPILPPLASKPDKIPPESITGGQQLLNPPVVGNKINRNYTATFDPDQFLASVGGTEVLPVPTIPNVHQSVGGTTLFNTTKTDIEFVTYPWTAGVYKINDKRKYSQQCGGTLVTETHVICAAHCFWDENNSIPKRPDDYMVALGKVYRDWDIGDAMVQRRSVRHLHIHPVFRGRKRNFQHDISVIELAEKVVFTTRVAPACLDWDNDLEERQLRDGNSGVVTGWGYTEDEKPSEVLRFVELPFVDANTCYDKLPKDLQLLLTTDKFCAGVSNGNTSVCPGDSGGGLLFKDNDYDVYFLRGIVSIAFRPPEFVGKCYYSEVSGFTSVSQSLPWLKRILKYID